MNDKIDISASIVIYKEDIQVLLKTVKCFLKTPLQKHLYIIDNSPTNVTSTLFDSNEITYIYLDSNVGFGSAHNLIVERIKEKSRFHLILNPDVAFQPQVLPSLLNEFERNDDIAMVSPKVVYPNGEDQYTCRKHPSFLELVSRRMRIFKKFTQNQEYRNQSLSEAFYPEFIHGCFSLFKTIDFVEIGGYDPQYFLYMEDADICRTLEKNNKKVLYCPSQTVQHMHRRGSSNNSLLFYHHLMSAIKYFKKWGF